MREFLCNSAYFGIVVCLSGYILGLWVRKKTKSALANPLLLAIAFGIAALKLLNVDYDSFRRSAAFLDYLLTPATVCLAVPLYQQLEILKGNLKAVLLGIGAGVLSSLGGVLLLSWAFGLSHQQYVTLLPKSVTTAIGISVSQELGGVTAITVAVIIVTGVIGNVLGESVLKLFRIREPIAAGLALGTASHAIGTAKAMEMGNVEGAMSSLAMAVAGILTVGGAAVFAGFY